MINKRRDSENVPILDLRNGQESLASRISRKSSSISTNKEQFELHPDFGTGNILRLKTGRLYVNISKIHLTKDLHFLPKETPGFLQLFFILSGEKIFRTANNQEYLLESMQACMIQKTFEKEVRILADKILKEIQIAVPLDYLKEYDVFKNEAGIEEEIILLPIHEQAFSILEDIQENDFCEQADVILLRARILELIAILLKTHTKNASNDLSATPDHILKKLSHIKKTILSNLRTNFSLEDLAMESGLNAHTLNNEFKRVFGCSINEFSISQKMEKARQDLENTNKMIYQIAEEVGYKNATHFSAAFKRKYRCTPRQFRNRL
ncbi:MAG: AraC family transcriptional regulator [Christiangramia sp.]|uniref:helix-turn-helix domain-containing protein n=1 Tax=Christiangramia sp. TaxID=1931228 RepID=UPI0032428AA8